MNSSFKELFKLYDLIENGDIRDIERYLDDRSANINHILPCKGIGVLHLAVGIEPIEKSAKCTELLLKHGADPNISSDDGMTPLHIASIWGRVENIKLLIGCGGDPSMQDLDGHSAFEYAAREQQWDVYDYLHNVEDAQDDSVGSKCAYSLDLERIMVTTNQVVAEYGPLTVCQLRDRSLCQKSEMVRDWCDKTTLTLNKLYPSILTETNWLNDNSVPWITEDYRPNTTHNIANQSLLQETKTSYKSCFSNKLSPEELCISGVKELEETNNKTCLCTCSGNLLNLGVNKQTFKLFENFSLPDSPTNMVHQNYNSKSNLKQCKLHCHSKSHSNNKSSQHSKSIITSDDSNRTYVIDNTLLTDDRYKVTNSHLNDAVVDAQNKVNEELSHSREHSDCFIIDNMYDMMTRRSSGSSNVSSSFCGGSIALASVEEEYKYEDKEEDVVLIEKRKLVTAVVLPIEEECDGDITISSVASSLPTSVEYDNCTLRTELIRCGFNPGPIDSSTKTLYLKKLHSLRRNPILRNVQGKTYSIELEKSLQSDEWMKDFAIYAKLEAKARVDFGNPNKKWREGVAKTSFTYLLLDPRTSNNLPAKAQSQTQHECWRTFVNSIFYVGKGKRSRPYSHLYQALTLWKRDFTTSKDKKVQHILDIWSQKVGVVCLHIFQNVIPAEAYTYEAAMIDLLGVTNLKNLKAGNYYGVTASWPLKERRMLGLYLLYKAMLIFLSEGERQLRPDDID